MIFNLVILPTNLNHNLSSCTNPTRNLRVSCGLQVTHLVLLSYVSLSWENEQLYFWSHDILHILYYFFINSSISFNVCLANLVLTKVI